MSYLEKFEEIKKKLALEAGYESLNKRKYAFLRVEEKAFCELISKNIQPEYFSALIGSDSHDEWEIRIHRAVFDSSVSFEGFKTLVDELMNYQRAELKNIQRNAESKFNNSRIIETKDGDQGA